MPNSLSEKEKKKLRKQFPEWLRETDFLEEWTEEGIYGYLERTKSYRPYEFFLPVSIKVFEFSLWLLGPLAEDMCKYTIARIKAKGNEALKKL